MEQAPLAPYLFWMVAQKLIRALRHVHPG